MLLCKLTDLELSGAPQLATREADRGRPTRPLERLVMSSSHECFPSPTCGWWPNQRPQRQAAPRS